MRITTILILIQVTFLTPTAAAVALVYSHNGKIEWGLAFSCAGLIVSMVASVLARKDGI